MIIRPARSDEQPAVAALLALALGEDPFIQWIAGDDHRRATAWMLSGLRMASRRGLVLVDDALTAGAVLMAPGAMPLPLRENLALVPGMARAVGWRRCRA